MQKMMLLTAAAVTMLAACGSAETSSETSANNEQAPVTQTTESTEAAEQTQPAEKETTDVSEQDESTTEKSTATETKTDASANAMTEEEDEAEEEVVAKKETKSATTEGSSKVTESDLSKPLSLNEQATDDSIVLYDMNDDTFIATRVDYNYAQDGSQTKKILMMLYDRYYNTYFNSYAVSKDETKIVLDLNGQGMLENNFAYAQENYVEIITSLFANFPKLQTVEFKVDGQAEALDDFPTTSRNEWKKMIDANGYNVDVVSND